MTVLAVLDRPAAPAAGPQLAPGAPWQVEIVSIGPGDSAGRVVAYATVAVNDAFLFHNVRFVRRASGSVTATVPHRPLLVDGNVVHTDDGRRVTVPIVTFTTREIWQTFSDATVAAARHVAPHLFTKDEGSLP